MKQFMWAMFAIIVITLFIIGDSVGVTGDGEVVACEGHLASSVASVLTTGMMCGALVYIVYMIIKLIREKDINL